MIRSERNVHIGCHVTKEVRDALEQIRRSRRMTMSAFIAEAIREKLEAEQQLAEALAAVRAKGRSAA